MKASELMIGDWVSCITTGEYHQIYRLNIGDRYIADDGLYAQYPDIINLLSDVEGIPLTEDILTMNGWKDSDPNLFNGLHYVFIYGKNHTLTLNHWTNRDTNEEYYTFAIGGGDRVLKYVHELQRALRCCGLFDLADNFKVTSDGVTTHTSEQKITD